MIYITKNKVKRLKTYPKSNFGIEVLKGIRWTCENNPEFKRIREQQLNDPNYKKERSERSLRRTRKRIQDLLNANLDEKSYFLTLTFKENIQDYEKANARFKYFMHQKNKDIKYLVVKEHQKRGAIHFHLIVFDIEPKDLENLLLSWNYGFKHYKHIKNKYSYSIANYLTNYMTKEKNQLVAANKKVFSNSRNLKRPLVISNDIINEIVLKHKYNVDLKAYDWSKHDYIIERKQNYDLAVKIKLPK